MNRDLSCADNGLRCSFEAFMEDSCVDAVVPFEKALAVALSPGSSPRLSRMHFGEIGFVSFKITLKGDLVVQAWAMRVQIRR